MRNSIELSTKTSRFTAHRHTTPWSIDNLTPLVPKDIEEVNAWVKRLQAMLDMATVVNPGLDHMDRRWGQDPDHHQSPREDSAGSITPPIVHGRDRDEGDLCDVIGNREAHDHIEK
jgi:hypothetical protein